MFWQPYFEKAHEVFDRFAIVGEAHHVKEMQLQIDCRKALGSFDDTDPEVDDQLLKATPQVEQFWQEFVRTEICHVSHRDDKDKKEAALNKVIDVSNIR